MKSMSLKLALSLGAILSLIACSGSGGGGSSSNDGKGNVSGENAAITKEEVVLRVGGICRKNRYYRVLETEVIPQDNGYMAVGQLILLDDGTYTLVAETLGVTQKGTKLYNYTRGQEKTAQGKWQIEAGKLKIEQGSLEKIADLSSSEGDEFYEFTDSSDPHARKIIFHSVEKLSERYIPSQFGCPNQQDLIARGQSGKFAIKKEDAIEGSHLFRYTPNRWNLQDLMSGAIGSHEEDNYFCKVFGQSVENCQAQLSYSSSQAGTVDVFNYNSNGIDRKVGFKMRVDDNHFEFETQDGRVFNLVPEVAASSFFLEETEESFSEM